MIALNGQFFAHKPQPIQAALHAFRATAPLSLLTQETKTRRFFTPLSRNSIIRFGHILAQAPQAVHLSSSTSGNPVSGLILMASNLQTSTQSPYPRHPKEHPVSPAYNWFEMRQLLAPSKKFFLGRFAQEPLQRTTATLGFASATDIPRIVAILDITG